MSLSFLHPDILKPLVINNFNDIYVSEKITSTIQECIGTPLSEIKSRLSDIRSTIKTQRNNLRIKIDYDDPVTLDAYIADFLPRNTLVPKLGLLCYSYNPVAFSNQERLNILDIGSGTGAIPLGLLDMFQEPSLCHIKCDIFAIDSTISALRKQKQLVKKYGLNGSTHDFEYVDLSNSKTYQKLLTDKQPFDLIFCSNVLSEMKPQDRENILAIIRDNLDDNGVCIIAESQNTPAKRACSYVSQNADQYGLNIYYPCPPDISCENQECWKWFNYYFVCDDIEIDGEEFEITTKHTIFWRIITKQDVSIYQYLNTNRKKHDWGITRYAPNIKCNEFCTESGQFDVSISPQLPCSEDENPWSQVMGISDKDNRIRVTWDPLNDFKSCNSEIDKEV